MEHLKDLLQHSSHSDDDDDDDDISEITHPHSA
jgi:hypothetical protein